MSTLSRLRGRHFYSQGEKSIVFGKDNLCNMKSWMVMVRGEMLSIGKKEGMGVSKWKYACVVTKTWKYTEHAAEDAGEMLP